MVLNTGEILNPIADTDWFVQVLTQFNDINLAFLDFVHECDLNSNEVYFVVL